MVEALHLRLNESLLLITKVESIVVSTEPRQKGSLGSSYRKVLRRICSWTLVGRDRGDGGSRLELRPIHDVTARWMRYI